MIQQYRTHRWNEACRSISKTKGRTFCQQIKKTPQEQKFHKIPSIIENNREYKTDSKKAEIFAEHYKQVYQYGKNKNFDAETETMIENWCRDYFNNPTMNTESIEVEEAPYYEILITPRIVQQDQIMDIVEKLQQNIHEHKMKLYK